MDNNLAPLSLSLLIYLLRMQKSLLTNEGTMEALEQVTSWMKQYYDKQHTPECCQRWDVAVGSGMSERADVGLG